MIVAVLLLAARFQSLNPYRTAPLWISAEDALTADGKLRPGAIAPAEESSLLSALERQQMDDHGCAVRLGPTFDFAPGMEIPQTWADIEQRAQAGIVISGVVTELNVGLYAGAPSTLVRIEPKRSNRDLPYETYLVYPLGSLVINGVPVCGVDPGYGAIPTIGDRILFVADQALDVSGTFFGPPAELIFYEHDRRLVPSPAATRRHLVRFKTLDALTRALIDQ